jgi:hypothetical protein
MANWSYTDAGSSYDVLQIQDLTSIPDSVKPGSEWRADIRANANDEIADGAYLEITVKLGLIKLLHKQYDLFEKLRADAAKDGWSLTLETGDAGEPIRKGDVRLTLAVQLPREIPSARFAIAVRARTVDDDDLAALDFKVDLATSQSG